MLFNSYEFIFYFFPVVFIGFFLLAKSSQSAAAGWLGIASLFFYGYWSIKALPLLLCSIMANYWFGKKLTPQLETEINNKNRKFTLYISLAANLALLVFFKYVNFFIANFNVALDALQQQQINTLNIALPIGISFFTFTQIAFLVDCWQGKVRERNFTHYLLFVSYFPHLIAGPVLHHSQMMPQFAKVDTYRPNYDKIAIGIAIFTIGLAKKLLIADQLSEYADVLFDNVSVGTIPRFFMSWFGVLAYTFQIYFDFSGYSDMAIGLSLFFGIHLPVNFNSPYKAVSIIDFWRRWHVSLSIFLREYLYIPLGGNRLGKFRRYLNLFITMLLGGLWHGASWTFVLWGAAHGCYLIINHAWRKFVGETYSYGIFGKTAYWLITFLSVCFAWVLFRADSLTTALSIYKGMLGLNGFSLPVRLNGVLPIFLSNHTAISFDGIWQALDMSSGGGVIMLSIAGIVSLAFPAFTQTALSRKENTLTRKLNLGLFVAILLWFCVLNLGKTSSFLYFQF